MPKNLNKSSVFATDIPEPACIGWLGMGHMASALLTGLMSAGLDEDQSLILAHPAHPARHPFPQSPKVPLVTPDAFLSQGPDILILAVKPSSVASALAAFDFDRLERPLLLISVVAGLSLSDLQAFVPGSKVHVVRAMPNMPVACRLGATACYGRRALPASMASWTQSLFASLGLLVDVDDEALMHAVTALSGSGPAYFFTWMQALRDAGASLGLPVDMADALALQTGLGALNMGAQSDQSWASLADSVRSPGGTTDAALNLYDQVGAAVDSFEEIPYDGSIIQRMVKAAHQRSINLSADTPTNEDTSS
jgi:pyrroline-5-carboxylate reductase